MKEEKFRNVAVSRTSVPIRQKSRMIRMTRSHLKMPITSKVMREMPMQDIFDEDPVANFTSAFNFEI